MDKPEAERKIRGWAQLTRPPDVRTAVRDAWYSEESGATTDLAEAIALVGYNRAVEITKAST